MMTNQQLVGLIEASKSASDCLRACFDLLSSGSAAFLTDQPGHASVAEALATFSVRKKTTAAAGVVIPGLDLLLARLAQRPARESVLLFHIATDDRVFSVFVAEDAATILGCVCLDRKENTGSAPA